VIGLEGEISALLYMQAEQDLAANAVGIVADDPVAREAAVEESVAAGAPTFLTRELPGIESRYTFTSDGVLARVWPRGAAQVGAPEVVLEYALEGAPLRIEGYDLARVPGVHEPLLRVTLYWRAVEPVTRTLKVSLRLLHEAGAAVTDAAGVPLVEDRFPLLQTAPTHTWLPGELLADGHIVPIGGSFARGRLQIIVYDASTVEEVGRLEIPIILSSN
jgi:hypothetical protein